MTERAVRERRESAVMERLLGPVRRRTARQCLDIKHQLPGAEHRKPTMVVQQGSQLQAQGTRPPRQHAQQLDQRLAGLHGPCQGQPLRPRQALPVVFGREAQTHFRGQRIRGRGIECGQAAAFVSQVGLLA
ncbi:hypothetical protein RZS08_19515, partial [Arthrospira platensis SPKY1]|nr:hypothetical protein [Arthrospira platensis SPKY1]